jgi:hypothetical protein
MASRTQSQPQPVLTVFESEAEIDAGIAKLHRRLVELSELDANVHRYDGPECKRVQSNIRRTILDVFGHDSPENLEHQFHSISEGRMWMNMPTSALQDNFRTGIDHSKAMLHGLIHRLHEAKLDLPKSKSLAQTESVTAKPPTLSKRIFIGHGKSIEWLKLKTFLVDRLGLSHEEFNRESPAGFSHKERLLQMLESSGFAFVVMTAEDEHADGTRHARESVIHEIGLFQGRHSFERAIVLLEDGCEEFSNIHGLNQIRFPRGDILAKSEEIRQVLEREGVL